MAQVEALPLLGLGVGTWEEVGLTNGPHFSVSTLSLTNPEAAV